MDPARVIVSEHCPPGQALIVDVSALGLDERGKLYVFHPEQRDAAIAVENALADAARHERVLSQFAAMQGLVDALS